MNQDSYQEREGVYKREEQTHDDSQFDDNRASEVDILYENSSFGVAYKKAYSLLGNLNGKIVLEYGCGVGRNLKYFCSKGASYVGIDISNLRISRAVEVIQSSNLRLQASVMKMNAEKLEFPDDSFDIVYGEAIIHHLDIDMAMNEIKRVLKPNGFALFIEPRGDNPIINRFRKKTPHLRTIDEHPLVKHDFDIMKKYFKIKENNYFFLSLGSFVFRKYVKSEFLFILSKIILDVIDSFLFATFPFIRKYAWYCVIKLTLNKSQG